MVSKVKLFLGVGLFFIFFIEATRSEVISKWILASPQLLQMSNESEDQTSSEPENTTNADSADKQKHRIETTGGKFTTGGVKEDMSFTIENIFHFVDFCDNKVKRTEIAPHFPPYIISPDLSIIYTFYDDTAIPTIKAYSLENKVKMVTEIKIPSLCKPSSWSTTPLQGSQANKDNSLQAGEFEEMLKFITRRFYYIKDDNRCVVFQGLNTIPVLVLLCNDKTRVSTSCYFIKNIERRLIHLGRLNKNIFIAKSSEVDQFYILRQNNTLKKMDIVAMFEKKRIAISNTHKNLAVYDDKKTEIYTTLSDTIKVDRTLEQKDIKSGDSLPYFQVITFSEDDKYLIIISNYNILYFYNLSTKSFDSKLQYNFGKLLEDQQIISFYQPWNGILFGVLDVSKKVESQHVQPDIYKYVFGEVDYKNKKISLNKYKGEVPVYSTYLGLYDKIWCYTSICSHITKNQVAFHGNAFNNENDTYRMYDNQIYVMNKDNNEILMRYYPPESYTIQGITTIEKKNSKHLKFILISQRKDMHTIHGLVATIPLTEILQEEK